MYFESVVLGVHDRGDSNEHRVPLIDSFHFHSHLETMRMSLQTHTEMGTNI